MPLKIQAASPEEHAFAAECNKRLAKTGARVHAYELVDEQAGSREYRIGFEYGSRRDGRVESSTPFHYDSPDDVVDRVKRWLAGNGANNLYSPDPKYAEDRELM